MLKLKVFSSVLIVITASICVFTHRNTQTNQLYSPTQELCRLFFPCLIHELTTAKDANF